MASPKAGGAPEDMFSPTSAAAFTLSTMHNFGAAVPPPPHSTSSSHRPTAEELSGTRLFNGTLSSAHKTANKGTEASVSWKDLQVQSHLIDPSPAMSRSVVIAEVVNQPTSMTQARLASSTSFVTPDPKKIKGEKVEDIATMVPTYSRKNKSLGVLAENFINKFKPCPPGSDIVVDNASKELGVERRRIYDVVNILESICLVSKEKKNTYKWMGTTQMDEVFGSLQAQAILDYPDDAKTFLEVSCDSDEVPSQRSDSSKSNSNKSLAGLSQAFLQLFLVGFETLSLPEASDKIQGSTSMEDLIKNGGGPELVRDPDGSPNLKNEKERKAAASRALKTKIRRLYDVANVFISVGLLQKNEALASGSTRRPSFSWSYELNAKEIRDRYVKTLAKPLVKSEQIPFAAVINGTNEKDTASQTSELP